MPVDKVLINRKITLISRDLKNIKELSDLSLAKYLSSDSYEAMAERYLERMIGRMIDINYHILVEDAGETPLDYYSSFVLMGVKKYLPREFADKIANSAGLRNRLAHEYDEIDSKKVYLAASTSLKEVPKYLEYIIKFLDKTAKQKRLV